MSEFETRAACPACSAASFETLLELSYDEDPIHSYVQNFYERQGAPEMWRVKGETYRLDRCDTCGLVFQRHVPNDDLLDAIYEKWIDPDLAYGFDFESRTVQYHAKHAREVERVLGMLGKMPRDVSVLDFGLGWAEWASMAVAYGCVVSGTELSPRRRAHAESLGVQIIDTLPTGQFDFINTEQVFEHVKHPADLLNELAGALTATGVLKISVPNGWNLDRRLQNFDWMLPTVHKLSLNPVAPLEHLNCYTRASMDYMAALAGLEPVGIGFQSFLANGVMGVQLEDVAKPAYHGLKKFLSRGAYSPTYAFYGRASASSR